MRKKRKACQIGRPKLHKNQIDKSSWRFGEGTYFVSDNIPGMFLHVFATIVSSCVFLYWHIQYGQIPPEKPSVGSGVSHQGCRLIGGCWLSFVVHAGLAENVGEIQNILGF